MAGCKKQNSSATSVLPSIISFTPISGSAGTTVVITGTKAMHLPGLAAIRHDERFKAIFARLLGRHGIKMKAVVAVQRKLLEIIYVLYKNQLLYDKEFLKQNDVEEKIEHIIKN
jgi:hypothetical protein